MRITADLITRCEHYINGLREHELSLRGYRINIIENLGVTEDQYDCIDFSDNEIELLDNFPRLYRLTMLLFHNNNISSIGSSFNSNNIPNLKDLILTNNNLNNLSFIYQLVTFRNLETLILVGNPMTEIENYRLFVIYILPQLNVLDYERIKDIEREEAENYFLNNNEGKKMLEELNNNNNNNSNNSNNENI